VDTTSVGPFKKGPFRIAMTVGVPIVPIIIRNAEIVAARDSMTMNPGTVDVAVFPPISVRDWTLDTLSDRIAEVRQLYVDTLADWPIDELPEPSLYSRKAAPKRAPRKAVRKAAKATTANAAAKKTAKAAQPKASATKTTKAQPGTPRPKGRS
jgi:putative phosphoserine phosphatase/1-acylglycerol-3-phosphate O-acyltransferase